MKKAAANEYFKNTRSQQPHNEIFSIITYDNYLN